MSDILRVTPPTETTSLAFLTIAIIDDNPETAGNVHQVLYEKKVRAAHVLNTYDKIVTAFDFQEANFQPDLLIINLESKSFNVPEIIKNVNQNPRLTNLPIIALANGSIPFGVVGEVQAFVPLEEVDERLVRMITRVVHPQQPPETHAQAA